MDNSEVEGPKPQTRVPDHPMLTNTTTRPFGYDWQNAWVPNSFDPNVTYFFLEVPACFEQSMIDLAKPNHKPTIHICIYIYTYKFGDCFYHMYIYTYTDYVYIHIYIYVYVCVCLCISSISGHIWGWFMSVPHQSVYLNFMLQGIGLSKTHGKPWFLESQIGFSFKIPLKPIWWMLMDRPLFSPGLSSMLFWCPSPSSIPGLLGILRLRSWRPGEIVRSHSCPIH